MIRALATLLAGALVLATPGAAQETGPLVRYGKWVLAAGAVGMNLLAAKAHNRAEDAFDAIEVACFDQRNRCNLGPDGAYVDRQIENLYQSSLHYDRSARRWLIAGETALVGAAALFVWEMTRKTHKPDNIPFEPEVRNLRRATGVGLRVAW
jgi:urocanate hydratase